jgi:hypothetical protein
MKITFELDEEIKEKINFVYNFFKNSEEDNKIKLNLIQDNFNDSMDIELIKRKDFLTLEEYNFFMDLKEKIKNSVKLFETEGIEGVKRSLNENFK